MRVFGNLSNRMMETPAKDAPKVGDGATILMYSDRVACTVIAVDGKRLTVQEDTCTRVDDRGQCESQEWSYAPNPDGEKKVFTLRKNGRYIQEHQSMRSGTYLRVGERDHYYDFGF